MRSKGLRWRIGPKAGRVSRAPIALAVALAAGVGASTPTLAASPLQLPHYFTGLINDYTPATGAAGTPYEMHGKWELTISAVQGNTDFTVEMTMETADFANPTPGDPTSLGAHTHHISVSDGVVHNDPLDPINWKTACPKFKPAVVGGFVVTGSAYVTGNGGNAPFGNPSAVTICVLGGAQNVNIATAQAFVQFSNLTLSFAAGSPASTHFGSQPINGVVSRCATAFTTVSSECTVAVVE